MQLLPTNFFAGGCPKLGVPFEGVYRGYIGLGFRVSISRRRRISRLGTEGFSLGSTGRWEQGPKLLSKP